MARVGSVAVASWLSCPSLSSQLKCPNCSTAPFSPHGTITRPASNRCVCSYAQLWSRSLRQGQIHVLLASKALLERRLLDTIRHLQLIHCALTGPQPSCIRLQSDTVLSGQRATTTEWTGSQHTVRCSRAAQRCTGITGRRWPCPIRSLAAVN